MKKKKKKKKKERKGKEMQNDHVTFKMDFIIHV